MAQVHVLSDLHLLDPSEPFYQSILEWMTRVPAPGDQVALAGDIFDVFVGNKRVFRELHSPFFGAVRSLLSRGIPVHHVEGNHDFWISRSYEESGCSTAQVHGDWIEIEMAGRRLRIEHGDLADHRDSTYLMLRRFFRSRIGSLLVDAAPGTWLDQLGRAWSNGSRDRQPELPETWSDRDRAELREVYFTYARKRLSETGAHSLVMGHCHDAHECEGYMNVGFPRRHQSWVRWTAATNQLERIPLKSP